MILSVILCVWGVSGCMYAVNKPVVLKDAFASKFMIGAALNEGQITGNAPSAEKTLIKEHFNTVTPENIMKWQGIHPKPEEFNFAPADKLVELAKENGMFVVGHTLIWHNQTPDWVFEDTEGNLLSHDALLARMKEHISKVVGRYKGRIGGWDVVNEGVDSDGTLRKTKWLEIIGPDYIAKAFQYAHEADPGAELYYNDYDMWKTEHREGVIRLVKDLQSRGIRVDGIGMQGHWGLNYPPLDEIEESIVAFSALGVKVMVTELDLTVLPSAWNDRGADITKSYELQERLNPYADGLPEEMQTKLADRYAEFFKLFCEHSDNISRVTFWGVQDGNSWRNNWPVRGRMDYPLVFDRNCNLKPAFNAIVKTAKEM